MTDAGKTQEPARIALNVAGLDPGERTALRELMQGITFQLPAIRLVELRPYLSAPEKPAEAQMESEMAAKVMLEEVDAALFAHGFGLMYGVRTLYAMREERDGDALMCAFDDDDFGVTRVQVKGIHDRAVSNATLNEEIAKLVRRYPTSTDLVVILALHMSQPEPLKDLVIPPELKLRGLYVLSAADAKLERWQLAGDLLQQRVGLEEFDYPVLVPAGTIRPTSP